MKRTVRLSIFLLFVFMNADVKAQLDSTRIAEIEKYAFDAPDSVSRTVQKLVSYLMLPAKTEEEKARIIYAWIAAHIKFDSATLNTGKIAECSAVSVLKKKKAVCLGMSMLYETLALEAGLEARTVIGFGKSEPSEAKKLRYPNHTWNVVMIDNAWQLVDVTFGSGYMKVRGKSKTVVKAYNNKWFNPDPRIMMYTHLPDNPKWSMINDKFDLAAFKTMPLVTPEFIKKGFSIDTVFEKTLKTPKHAVVQIYHTKKDWKILEAPADGQLIKGKQYSIHLQTSKYERIAVVSGREIYNGLVLNGTCKLDFIASGKTQVVFFEKKKSKKGEIGLVYTLGKK